MAVACGVRLSCSVFTVYSVLLSVSLVARAIPIARRLQVYKRREHHDICVAGAKENVRRQHRSL